MSQKKILLLGGSAQQVIAIKTAKELGYYTVLCDYLPDNLASMLQINIIMQVLLMLRMFIK